MEIKEISENKEELISLCRTAKELIGIHDYQKCEILICNLIGRYPHAPEPHNLLGILAEKMGDHPSAMKHFRAACALDPTHQPARQNLECYSTFFSNGRRAYDESDCISVETIGNCSNYKAEYDSHGVGHIIRRD